MMSAVTSDPEVMHGAPVFIGTRVPVQTSFEYLECGDSLTDFLEGSPLSLGLSHCRLWKKPNYSYWRTVDSSLD